MKLPENLWPPTVPNALQSKQNSKKEEKVF
jgi:hypothetical protein